MREPNMANSKTLTLRRARPMSGRVDGIASKDVEVDGDHRVADSLPSSAGDEPSPHSTFDRAQPNGDEVDARMAKIANYQYPAKAPTRGGSLSTQVAKVHEIAARKAMPRGSRKPAPTGTARRSIRTGKPVMAALLKSPRRKPCPRIRKQTWRRSKFRGLTQGS